MILLPSGDEQNLNVMRTTRRNIPDPVSPQNPVIQKDVIDTNRIQDELEEKTSVEEILSTDDNDTKRRQTENKPFKGSNDNNLEDES
jgi:hypothetical protein